MHVRSLAPRAAAFIPLALAAAAVAVISACGDRSRASSDSPAHVSSAASSVDASSVIPAAQTIAEGQAASWNGLVYLVEQTDGRPTRVAWDFEGDGSDDQVVCDDSASPRCFMTCRAGTQVPGSMESPLGAGAQPARIVKGRFDGDAFDDVAVLDYGNAVILVYLSTTPGTVATYSTGTSPTDLAVGDINHDGHPDLAVVNAGDSTVSVLLGSATGDGSFAPGVAYAVPAGGYHLTLVDVNGDLQDDVAVASVAGTLSVLPGKSDGTLGSRSDYATIAFPVAIAAADVDHDGSNDLVLLDGSSNLIGAQLNDGTGDFSVAPKTFLTSYAGGTLAVTDLDEDGYPDVLVVNGVSSVKSLDVMMNDGGGQFLPPVSMTAGLPASGVTSGDLDGDGHADVVLTLDAGFVVVWLGDGKGGLGGFASYAVAVGDPTAQPLAPAILDGNADGHPDIYTANFGGATVSLLLGDSKTEWSCVVNAAHAFTDSKGAGSGPSATWPATLNTQTSTGTTDATVRSVTVTDVAPTPDVAFASMPVAEGQPLLVTFSWSDPGANDAVSLHLDWGDGTSTDVPGQPASGSAYLAHVYPNAGTWNLTGQAQDDEAASAPVTPVDAFVVDTPPVISSVVTNSPVPVGQPARIWINMQSATGDVLTYDFAWDGDGAFTGPDDVTGLSSNTASFTSSVAGTVTVPVRVHDDDGNVATGSVDVTWLPSGSTNQWPIAVDDAISTNENTPKTVTIASLLANDSDPDAGDMIAFVSASQGAHGSVSVEGANLVWSPRSNFFGTDAFAYTIRDTAGATATATVTVTVAHVNQAPVANADALVTAEDAATTIAASTLAANDTDADGDALTVTAVSSPVNGMVALASGNVTFTPTAGFSGTAGFSYTVGDGALTATGSVTVSVLPVNHVPGTPSIASPAAGATVSSTTPALVIAPATDADGDALTYDFEIDASPTFDSAALQISQLVSTTSFTPAALTEDATWYWRARASDGTAHGDWAMSHFTVNASDAAPSAPIPIAPVGGATVERTGVSLRVLDATDVDGVTRTYVFTLAKDAAGTQVVETSPAVPETPGTTSWAPTTALAAGAHYYWSATATDESGVIGPASSVETFGVAGGGGGTKGGCNVGERDAAAGPGPVGAATGALLAGLAGILLATRRRLA